MHGSMRHGLALALALACAQACAVTTSAEGAKQSDGSSPDSAPGSTEPAPRAASTAGAFARATQLSTPVAVVALTAADARPCERMCGRLGDCLRERDEINASYLELGCLDLCVNAKDSSDAGKLFHACGQREACDPLLRCASDTWDAAAAARVEFVAQIDAAPSYDACELVCGGFQSCTMYSQPLHRFDDRDEQFDREVQACVTNCDPRESMIIELAHCARADTCDEQWDCWTRTRSY